MRPMREAPDQARLRAMNLPTFSLPCETAAGFFCPESAKLSPESSARALRVRGQSGTLDRLLLLAVIFGFGTAGAQAARVGMPEGARSWIEVSSNNMADEVGRVGNLGLTGELLASGGPGSIRAAGSTGADYLRGYLQSTGNATSFLWVSKVDTFTLHSDTLAAGTAVNFSVALEVEGTTTISIGPTSTGSLPYGYAGASARIGTWNGSSSQTFNENLRVTGRPGNGVGTGLVQHSVNTSDEFVTGLSGTALVGTPFDLGFSLLLNGANMILDYSHTARITFDLTGDLTVTSVDGFGATPPAAGVPDSGLTLALVLLGAGSLGLVRRIGDRAARRAG